MLDVRYGGSVKDVTTNNFGLLIAFVLPGFVLLWGMAPYSSTISEWLGQATSNAPTVGGFLYVTLASVGLGVAQHGRRQVVRQLPGNQDA